MKSLHKWGSIAAFYMAIAYIIGIILFIFVLDYPHIIEPSQKIALLAAQPTVIYFTNFILYVLFGIALVVFTCALRERLKSTAPGVTDVACVLSFIWAGLLIASGMVANAGIEPAIALFKRNPAQASIYWSGVESVTNGLSCVNGEILGGVITLLISIAAFRAPGFSRPVIYLGGIVGTIGIVSVIPALKDLTAVFGMSQIIWFVCVGVILLRKFSDTVKTLDK